MANIETLELKKYSRNILREILAAAEAVDPAGLGIQDFYTGGQTTWAIPELGLSYKNTTAEEFKKILVRSTEESSFRRAYAKVYELSQSSRAESTEMKGAEKSPVDSNIPDAATREFQRMEEEKVKAEKAEIERKVKEQTQAEIDARQKIAEEQRTIQEGIRKANETRDAIRNKVYIKVTQPEIADNPKFASIKEAADLNPPVLVDQIATEVGNRIKNTDHGSLSDEEIEYLSKQTAYQFVEGVRGNSAAVKGKILEKIATDKDALAHISPDADVQNNLIEYSNYLAERQAKTYFQTQRISESYLGQEVAGVGFGAKNLSDINVELSLTPKEGFTEFDPSEIPGDFGGILDEERQILGDLGGYGKAAFKARALQFAGQQLTKVVSRMAPESFIYQAYNTEVVQGILSISGLGAPISWESTNFFGQLAIDTGYGNLFGWMGRITGWDLGVIESLPGGAAVTETMAAETLTMVPTYTAETLSTLGTGGFETLATMGSGGATTLATGGSIGATTTMSAAGTITSTAATGVATEVATTVTAGAAAELSTTAVGAAAGTAIPVPVVGTVIGAIIGFFAGLVGGKVLGKAISNFSVWVKENDLGRMALALPVMGIVGLTSGFGAGVFAGGVTYGGLSLASGGLSGLGSSAANIFNGARGAASAVWGTFLAGIGTPIIAAVVGFPILVAFMLFVINSGAYVVPPPSLGNPFGGGTTINCSTDKGPVGVDDPGPPSSSNKIANRGWEITFDLYQGFWCFWNRSPKAPAPYFPTDVAPKYPPGYPQEFNYKLFQSNPNGAEGSYGADDMFWCTWLIVKAYQESGNNIGTNIYVPNMYDDFLANGHTMIKAADATPANIKEGSVVFYQVQGGEFSDRLNHVSIVYKVDPSGMTVVESNSPLKSERISFSNPTNAGTVMLVRYYGLP